MSARPRHARMSGSVLAAGGLLLACLLPSATASARSVGPSIVLYYPGQWHQVGTTGLAMTPVVYDEPTGEAVVIWMEEPAPDRFSFDQDYISASGALTASVLAFPKPFWSSLNTTAAIVAGPGGAPLFVFSGARSSNILDPYSTGCIVGALGAPKSPAPWVLQKWSLSGHCDIPESDAALGGNGQVAAAWPGGWSGGHGLLYRLQRSGSNPAFGPDREVALPPSASVVKMAVAANSAGNGDVWAYWGQFGSTPSGADGWYAKDLTANGPVRKAPLSVHGSADLNVAARPAFATTNSHAGVFSLYDVPPSGPSYINCSNGQYCTVRLWRVGSPKAVAVPGAVHVMADDLALSAGPKGRLWIAWFSAHQETVNVLRTNEADSEFGPVKTYPTPCTGYGVLGTGSGELQRLDVAVQCPTKTAPLAVEVSQVLAPLSLKFTTTIVNTLAHTIHLKVTDVGDPVPGAVVRVGKITVSTGPTGIASVVLPKGQKPGSYPVTATAANYTSATGTLTVTS